jgi:hypothetical protein
MAFANTRRVYYLLYTISFGLTYFMLLQQTTIIPKSLSLQEWKGILISIIKPLPNSVVPGLTLEILLMFLKTKCFQLLVTGIFVYMCQQVKLNSNKFLLMTYQRHVGYRQQFLMPFVPFIALWQWVFRTPEPPHQTQLVNHGASELEIPPEQPTGQPSYEEEPTSDDKGIFGSWRPYPTEHSFTFITCISRAICHVILLPLDTYITRIIVHGYLARGLPIRTGLPPIISPSFNPLLEQPVGQWTHQFGLTIVLDCLTCLITHWT